MKKVLMLLIIAFMIGLLPAYATDKIRVSPEVYLGIQKYKEGNYASCIQQMREAIKKMKDDASIPYYYIGNSYVQLGRPEDAKTAYNKVVEINKSLGLVSLSKGAITYLDNIQNVEKADDMREFIESKKFLHKEVIKDLEDKDIQNVQTEINSKSNKEDSVDFNKYRYINDASQNMPTDEEIATAVKILARVGYNPYNQQNFNSDYMTMMSMMGGQNNGMNNNFASMLPYIMSQSNQYGNNNQQGINQQMLQNLMLRGMSQGF